MLAHTFELGVALVSGSGPRRSESRWVLPPAGRTPSLLVSPSWVRAAHGPPRIMCGPAH
jgi:hypothetical protein